VAAKQAASSPNKQIVNQQSFFICVSCRSFLIEDDSFRLTRFCERVGELVEVLSVVDLDGHRSGQSDQLIGAESGTTPTFI